MRSEVVTITPEMAREMLKMNTRNRNISKERVALYAKRILKGEWKEDGQSISFDKNGRLLNGQHRLLAIIKAGKPITTVVVYDVEPGIDTYDDQRVRRARDVAAIRGLPIQPSAVGAISMILYCGREFISDRNEIVDFLEADYESWKIASTCCYSGSAKGLLKKAGCIAAVYIALKTHLLTQEQLQNFCVIANTGCPISGSVPNAPLMLSRTLIDGLVNPETKQMVVIGDLYKQMCMEVTFAALKDFKNNKSVTRKYKPTGDAKELCEGFRNTMLMPRICKGEDRLC